MSALLSARVDGTPGPKGSLNGFCLSPCCVKRRRSGLSVPAPVMKEQSENGVKFRKLVAGQLKWQLVAEHVNEIYTGPVETRLTFFIARQRVVRAGVEQDEWVPSHRTPVPTHRGSGDVEKHIRTVHDALMDAGVLADDSQVWRTVAAKLWATDENPPGVQIEVREMLS